MPSGTFERKRRPIFERLMKRTVVDMNTNCVVWTGAVGFGGHGQIRSEKHKLLATHRVSWEHHNGPIPEGMKLCHRCDNPPCINPDHLFLGTQADNMRDMIAKGRNRRGETHHNAKVTDDQVRDIIAATGTQREIAKRFKLSQQHIGVLKRREQRA